MGFNRVTARGVKGVYKDKHIEIEIGKTSEDTKVFVNGEQIKTLFGIHIHMRAGKPTEVIMEGHNL